MVGGLPYFWPLIIGMTPEDGKDYFRHGPTAEPVHTLKGYVALDNSKQASCAGMGVLGGFLSRQSVGLLTTRFLFLS